MNVNLCVKRLILSGLRQNSIKHLRDNVTGQIKVASMVFICASNDFYVDVFIPCNSGTQIRFSILFSDFDTWFTKVFNMYINYRHFNSDCLPIEKVPVVKDDFSVSTPVK